VPDVDAQLKRRGGHQCLKLAGLEPFLGIQPGFLGEAAVMRGDGVLAEALGQVSGHPFGQPAGVDENDGGLMRVDQFCEAIVYLGPSIA
jgi:hypothetical protein